MSKRKWVGVFVVIMVLLGGTFAIFFARSDNTSAPDITDSEAISYEEYLKTPAGQGKVISAEDGDFSYEDKQIMAETSFDYYKRLIEQGDKYYGNYVQLILAAHTLGKSDEANRYYGELVDLEVVAEDAVQKQSALDSITQDTGVGK